MQIGDDGTDFLECTAAFKSMPASPKNYKKLQFRTASTIHDPEKK
jgi:hypothetical protein